MIKHLNSLAGLGRANFPKDTLVRLKHDSLQVIAKIDPKTVVDIVLRITRDEWLHLLMKTNNSDQVLDYLFDHKERFQ